MAGKPIATMGSMHMCPMCSGYVPHVGGPISGPGAPNVLINGKPAALMGDMCVCVGPPDVVAQGNPSVLINGVPVVCQGDLTAHGGAITAGEPNVMVSVATPGAVATMPLSQIPFPEIRLVDKLGAALSGGTADITEAQGNIEAIQRGDAEVEPRIFNVRWIKESVNIKNTRELREVTLSADVLSVEDGESVDFVIERRNVLDDSVQTYELSATVQDGSAQVNWEVEEQVASSEGSGFDQLLAECTFTARVQGVEEVSRILEVEPETTKLHFKRYIINKKEAGHLVYPQIDKTKDLKPDNDPKLNGYNYNSSVLRTGYVYLVYENDKIVKTEDQNSTVNNHSIEFEVLYGGLLRKVTTPQTEEVRDDVEKRTFSHYSLVQEDVVWAMYSDTQLKPEQIDELRNDSAKRQKQMQKFVAKDWMDKQKFNHSLCINDIYSIFKRDEVDQMPSPLVQNSLAPVICSVSLNQWTAQYNNTKVLDTQEQKTDAFLILHDPVGDFIELTTELNNEWTKMESLLISMKLGVKAIDVEYCLREGIDPEELQKDKKKLEQIKALYNIAVNIKGVGFSSEDNIDKIGEEIDAKRLDVVLAREERLVIKNRIKILRKKITKFLKSKYFNNTLDLYINNDDERIALAKFELATLLKKLTLLPNNRDFFIETPKEREQWSKSNDDANRFIKDVLLNKNKLGELFHKEITLKDQKTGNQAKYTADKTKDKNAANHVEDSAKYLKAFALTNSIMDISSGLIEDGEEILESINEINKKIQIATSKGIVKGTTELTTLGKVYNKALHKIFDDAPDAITHWEKALNISKKSLKAFNKSSKSFSKEFNKLCNAKQLAFTTAFKNAIDSAPNKTISTIQSSGIWKKALRNVSFINLGMATLSLGKGDNLYQIGLNISKFVVAMGDAHVAWRNVNITKLVSKGTATDAIEAFGKTTAKQAKIFGYAGAIIDAGEAGLNVWERDYDAAAAYGSAAACGIVGLIMVGGVANCWNPVGWGLIIVGIAAGFAAGYFEDTPLERICKNGVFGEVPHSWLFFDVVKFNGNYLQQIHQHVLPDVRDKMHKTGFSDWEDYPTQYIKLMDILIGGRIRLTPEKYTHEEGKSYPTGAPYGAGIVRTDKDFVHTFKVEISFGDYLTEIEQLEYHIIYQKQGQGSGAYTFIDKKTILLKLVETENKPTTAVFTFNVDNSQHTQYGLFMVAARMKLNEGEYFPLESSNAPRYVASICPAIVSKTQGGWMFYDNVNSVVVIDTITKLVNKKQWK